MVNLTHPLTLTNLSNLLVILPSWVGDCVMATPLLRALRTEPTAAAELRITGYLRGGLDEILAGSGLLDEMIVGQPAGWGGPFVEAKRLRARGFDAVIILPNSFRLALLPLLARIPWRIGYGRDGRSRLLSHPVKCPRPGGWQVPIPAVDYYLNLATQAGFIESADASLQLACTPEQQGQAERILQEAGIAEGDRVALLNPGGNRTDKRWPIENYIRLAEWLHGTYGLKVLVNGSPGERGLLEAICAGVNAAVPICNLAEFGVTLGSLKGICRRAEILITNDTGTRHLAIGSAFESMQEQDQNSVRTSPIRVVTLFGPTDPGWTTLNYQHEIEVSTGGKPIKTITVEQVCTACGLLLGRRSGAVRE